MLPQGLHNRKCVWSAFPHFFFFFYVGLLSIAVEISKMLATVMKDSYEKNELKLYEVVMIMIAIIINTFLEH